MATPLLDPSIITSIDLLTLHDQRAVGQEVSMPGITPDLYSTYTIPANGVVTLREEPKQLQLTIPTGVSVTQVPGGPFTEVFGSASAGQFVVGYTDGTVVFNAADVGKNVLISYLGRGSVVKAAHVNNVNVALAPFLPVGGNINLPAGNLNVTGDLNVTGVVNRTVLEVLDVADSIILLNDKGSPSLVTAGIEISRAVSPLHGSPLNASLLWVEASTSWAFLSTSTGPTGVAGYALQKVYNKGGVQGTLLTGAQETSLVATLGVGDAGLQWFNTTDNQFKGWSGTAIVILG